VTRPTRQQRSTSATLRAARAIGRRGWLKRAAGAGLLAAAAPWIVRDAFSSSGELSILNWSDELPDPIVSDFVKKTGIKVSTTPFSRNEEQVSRLQATKGAGFDLCQPPRDRAPQFKDLGLLQPFDLDRLPNVKQVIPSTMEASTSIWTWDGKLYHLPHCWGTEAMAWRTDQWLGDPKTLSYGDLWADEVKGRILVRPYSLVTGIGLWMDATGKLPSNRMLDAFQDEDSMRRIWTPLTQFAIDHKSWIKVSWVNTADIENGLMRNGCVLGQAWSGPVQNLRQQGRPVAYQAPREGAIAWLDGWGLLSAAENVEQAIEWMSYLMTPEVSAKVAEGSGYNPVIQGADALLPAETRTLFQEAYPGDALARLWWRPPEPNWYIRARKEYADKFQSA
jgi:spermidine/putrescine transport system substrate-binding protein